MQNYNKTKKQKRKAFYDRGSWYHRTRTLQEDKTVKYGTKGGFKTFEEAEKSYDIYKEEFNKQLTIHNMKIKQDVMLKDYLNYWFENIYSAKVKSNTVLGTAYAVYNFIIPNIKKDIKLELITEDYLDDILKRCSKITESAGYTCRSVLNMAIKDAVIERLYYL